MICIGMITKINPFWVQMAFRFNGSTNIKVNVHEVPLHRHLTQMWPSELNFCNLMIIDASHSLQRAKITSQSFHKIYVDIFTTNSNVSL